MKGKTKNDYSEIMLVCALVFTMVSIPCAHYFCALKYKPYSVIAKTAYFSAIMCICAAAYAALHRGRRKISVYGVASAALTCFLTVSVINAYDITTAIKGSDGRNEGFLMLMCYLVFFYTARMLSEEKSREFIVYCFMFFTFIHCLYGLCQFFDINIYGVMDSYHYAISGVTGNPNFMGSLMVIAVGIGAGITYEKIRRKSDSEYTAYCFVRTLLFGAVLILTRAVSAYAGAVTAVSAAGLFVIADIRKKKGNGAAAAAVLAVAGAALAVFCIADELLYGYMTKELMVSYSQLKDFITTGYADEYFASGRLVIWKNVLEMLPGNMWTGIGPDCLKDAYYAFHGTLFDGRFVDKVHNEFLQILITDGLPALICFLLIYAAAFRDGLKKRKSGKGIIYTGLVCAFAGYMVQAFFNISVVDVAPYLWITAGLMAKPVYDEQIHT